MGRCFVFAARVDLCRNVTRYPHLLSMDVIYPLAWFCNAYDQGNRTKLCLGLLTCSIIL